jgi:surface antigen
MRSMHLLPWHPLVGLAAVLAAIALLPPAARAESLEVRGSGTGQTAQTAPPATSCPPPSTLDVARTPDELKTLDIRPVFDDRDEVAALEAVQLALTEVGDGSTYVWYRHGGRLSGLVQPTQSFRDAFGRVCRHIVVTLNDASRSKRTESIACRMSDGGWELDG